jgi:hypothetical protein
MSDFADQLNALLRKPVRTPQDAERAARAAEALGELLRAEDKAERILSGESTDRSAQAGENLSGKTLQDAAEAVLEEAGKPLHAKELGQRIKARGWNHPRGKPSRPDQIVYQLAARLPRYPERFRRVAPNTFGLTKWADAPPRPARRPKVGLFHGPGGDVGRQIGESPNEPAEADSWRSS